MDGSAHHRQQPRAWPHPGEDYEREHAYGPAELRLLQSIAATMGLALENAQLFDETQRRARESDVLAQVGRELSSSLDLASVLDRIARHARELLGASTSAIFVPQPDGTHRAAVVVGELAERLRSAVIQPGRGIIGHLLRCGRAELVNDASRAGRLRRLPANRCQVLSRTGVLAREAVHCRGLCTAI